MSMRSSSQMYGGPASPATTPNEFNMMPYGQQQQAGPGGVRYPMPPGTFNRGTRMEHLANNTLNQRSFGTVLGSSHRDQELNTSVVREIQMDWDNRQYLEAITLGIKKIADFLNKFNLSCQTRLAYLNERLSNLERQLDYIQAKVPRPPTAAAAAPN